MFPFLLWGRLKERGDAALPTTLEDLVLRFQEIVTTVDAKTVRCPREHGVRRTALCLEIDGGNFEHFL